MEQNGSGGGRSLNSQCIREGFMYYYVIKEGESKENYKMKMLLNNQIKGLLTYEYRGQGSHYYQIEGLKSLDYIITKEMVSLLDVKNIFYQLFQTIHEVESFFLNIDELQLTPENMYLDGGGKQLKLCYYPYGGKDIKDQITQFIEYLMNHINHKEEELVVFIYGMYRMIREEFISLESLEEYVMNNQDEHKTINEKKKDGHIEKKEDRLEQIPVEKKVWNQDNALDKKEKRKEEEKNYKEERESVLDVIKRRMKRGM